MAVEPVNITIPYKFIPRTYQVPLFNAIVGEHVKRAATVWHRRAGKDKTLLNILITMAWAKRVGAYYYFLPTLKQARKIVWDGIGKDGFPFLSHIPEEIRANTNSTEMKIKLTNGSLFQLVGSDNIDSIVGTNPVGCIFSEYSLQDPTGWDFVRPILRENGGWAAFNFTPRGKNHAHRLFKLALKNPTWFCEKLTVADTGVLTPEDIEQERLDGMDDDLIEQEFYCSFEASIPGAYYSKQMKAADTQGRICGVPIDSGVPVDTWWDLGMDDSTSIWFSQNVGREIHFINYYENSGEPLAHYANEITKFVNTNGAMVGRVHLPHDGAKRELQSGKSAQDFLYDLGFSADIAPRPAKKEDGIESCRQILGKCWFDENKCERGVEGLKQFRKEWNEKDGVFALRPVHDWTSHPADAFQTFALLHRFHKGGGGFRPNRGKKTRSYGRHGKR